jgi:hypothetical protein
VRHRFFLTFWYLPFTAEMTPDIESNQKETDKTNDEINIIEDWFESIQLITEGCN